MQPIAARSRPARRPRRLPQGRIEEQRGQATVEFAIVVSILLLVVVGILFFGRYLNYTIDETHLANIAARFASVNSDPACTNNDPTACSTTLAQYIQSQADGELHGGSPSVAAAKVCIVQPSGASQAQGSPVEATVTSTFSPIPFVNGMAAFTVTQTAYMMLEQNPASQLYGCSS
jgi:Flp pilus assembly protein TadG